MVFHPPFVVCSSHSIQQTIKTQANVSYTRKHYQLLHTLTDPMIAFEKQYSLAIPTANPTTHPYYPTTKGSYKPPRKLIKFLVRVPLGFHSVASYLRAAAGLQPFSSDRASWKSL
jgi:hypothetical protein